MQITSKKNQEGEKMLDVDSTQIYDSSTGETVGELESLNREQLKELLEVKESE